MHVVIHVAGEELSSWLPAPWGCLILASVWLTWVKAQHIFTAALFDIISYYNERSGAWKCSQLGFSARAWHHESELDYITCLNVASESGLVSDLRDGTLILKAPSSLCAEAGAWWLNWSWGTISRCNASMTPAPPPSRLADKWERARTILISWGPENHSVIRRWHSDVLIVYLIYFVCWIWDVSCWHVMRLALW